MILYVIAALLVVVVLQNVKPPEHMTKQRAQISLLIMFAGIGLVIGALS